MTGRFTLLQRILNPGRSPGTNLDPRRSAHDAVGSFWLHGAPIPEVGGHTLHEPQTRTVTGTWEHAWGTSWPCAPWSLAKSGLFEAVA